MYVIEHAFLNLVKNKSRNILLGVIIFAIITATVVALAINNAAGHFIEETKLALQCAVRVTPQRQMVGNTGGTAGGTAVGTAGGNIGENDSENSGVITPQRQPSENDSENSGAITPPSQSTVNASENTSATTPQTNNRQEAAISLEQYISFSESRYLDGADIKENSRSADGVDATYYLIRPDMLSAFEAELRNKGLPDGYSVRTDESAFERMVSPVESLKNLSFTFLLIVLVLGSVIMILLSVIAIRERKYEIGVLRAMGMKKQKIALGLWTEITVITCICFALGMGAGTALSQPVSDAIMTGQAQSSEAGSTSLADRLSETDATTAAAAAPSENIAIAVDGITALEIFGVSILLASIAGVISVSRITKSEPIKILMERS